jgi:hypothetical protein
MMISEIRLPFGPANVGCISQGPNASPRPKGIPVPTIGPAHFASFFASKPLLRFRAGQEHQEEQPEPVHETEQITVMLRLRHQTCCPRQSSNECRPEDDTSQDFTDDFGSVQLQENPAQQLSKSHEKQKNKED